jgi:hypothetical protein
MDAHDNICAAAAALQQLASKNLKAGRPGTVECEPHLRIAFVGNWKRQGVSD